VEDLEIQGVLGIAGLGSVDFEQEVGAVLRANPNMNAGKAAATAAAQAIRRSAVHSTATRAQRLILANISRFPVEIQTKIRSGNAKMEDLHLFVRKNIVTGTGTQELINETNVKKAGVSNIDKNRIEEGLVALVTGIRVTSGASATVTDPSLVGYANTQAIGTGATNLPVSLANAELIVKKGGNIIFTCPMSKFYNPGGSYASIPGQYDTYQLNNPFLYDSSSAVGLEVKFAEGATLPIAQNFVQVELLGVAIRA